MKSRWVAITLTALTISGIFAACTRTEQGSAGPREKVTVALATAPETALAQVAQSQGFYGEAGLEVTTHLHRYGKLALKELLEGKADFATVAETPVMFAILEGHQIEVIATIMTSSMNNAVVARKDRGIARFQALKGKRVAATLGTTSEFYLYSVLVTNGISPKDVTVVNLSAESMYEALARGEIDAASTFLPYTMLIQKTLGPQAVLLRDSNVYRESFNIVATREFIRSHPAAVVKMLKSLLKAEEFAGSHPEEAQKIVADNTGLQMDLVRDLWRDSTFSIVLDQTLMLSLEDESEWAIKNNLTKAKNVPNFLNYIYLDGLRSLKPGAVRILK